MGQLAIRKGHIFTKMALIYKVSVPGYADAGVPNGDGGWPQDSTQMSRGVRIKFLLAIITMPNNISSLKYALISVPGLADVGVPHEVGDGPRAPP